MVESTTYKSKARLYGSLCTMMVAGTLILVLLFIILRTPIPPYPEGGGGAGNGIELNLGYSAAGMGNNPQELSAPEEKEHESDVQTKPDNIITQEVEDAPAINENTDLKKNKKDIPKEVSKNTHKPTENKSDKPIQVVNTKALYHSTNNQTSADGDSHIAGDQGSTEGSLGAKAFGNKGGQGGTGGGIGTGSGKGVGSGISYSLEGRSPFSLPNPEYNSQSEGVVVVEVIVDKEGNVTQAIPGKKGTTTTDSHLWDAAQSAAKHAKFDRKPDAPAFQKGTITYRFRLQ